MMGQKRQVHDMREILLLEDDTTLGRGIQLALQGPDVTIALTGTLSQAREMLVAGRAYQPLGCRKYRLAGTALAAV